MPKLPPGDFPGGAAYETRTGVAGTVKAHTMVVPILKFQSRVRNFLKKPLPPIPHCMRSKMKKAASVLSLVPLLGTAKSCGRRFPQFNVAPTSFPAPGCLPVPSYRGYRLIDRSESASCRKIPAACGTPREGRTLHPHDRYFQF